MTQNNDSTHYVSDQIADAGAHPEDICQDCGQPNPPWFAPNEIWNKFVPDRVGIFCPNCFAKRAKEKGFAEYWKFAPETEFDRAQAQEVNDLRAATRETRGTPPPDIFDIWDDFKESYIPKLPKNGPPPQALLCWMEDWAIFYAGTLRYQAAPGTLCKCGHLFKNHLSIGNCAVENVTPECECKAFDALAVSQPVAPPPPLAHRTLQRVFNELNDPEQGESERWVKIEEILHEYFRAARRRTSRYTASAPTSV
jgi:hypothetical protein